MQTFVSKRSLTYIAISLITALIIASAYFLNLGPISRGERMVLDRFYRLRGPLEPSQKIVLAVVDEKTIEQFGPWPWKHRVYVKLIERLREIGVKVAVFDASVAQVVVSEDRKLRDSIGEQKDLVFGYTFYPTREDIPLDDKEWATGEDSFDVLTTQKITSVRVPLEHLPGMGGIKTVPSRLRVISGTLGFTNLLPAKDTAITSVPTLVRYKNVVLPSLALTAVARAEGFTPLVREKDGGNVKAVAVGKKTIPLNKSGRMLLNMAGPAGTYKYRSLADIFDEKADLKDLEDTIVIIGSLQGDKIATPFGSDVPVIEVWANAMDDMLYGKPLIDTASSKGATAGIIVIIALILGIALPRVRIMPSLGIAILVAAAVVVDGYLFFAYAHRWFAMVTPLLVIFFVWVAVTEYRYATEERVRKKFMMRFGSFMGKKTITSLVTRPARLPSKGEKRLMTAMTVGIRRFEHMCSELDAKNLIAFMKGYYREILPVLHGEDAYVVMSGNDKLVCTLGAPVLHSDHALRACRAMLGIRRAVAKRRPGWKERYRLGTLRLRAGIHTGPMAIGDAGNGFAAVGTPLDMSELWARIARTYRVSIVCGPETVHAAREKFFFRPLDYVSVPHGQHPVEIFELMGERSIATPYMDVYVRAYEAYRERDYRSAVVAADKVLENLPHDGPSLLIKARSERFLKKPPQKEWDGAWIVK